MHYRSILAISLIFLIGMGSAHGKSAVQTLNKKALKGLAQQYLIEHNPDESLTALAITVRQFKSAKALNADVGTMGINEANPISEKSLFQIGSLTKSFIAAILLQLEADSNYQLKLEDPVSRWLPEYPKWDGVTIRMLLNMTSGIPDHFKNARNYNHYLNEPFRKHVKREWVDVTYQQPFMFAPGTQFSYSNTNYILLGMIIERATGRPLAQVIQTRLLDPLQLHSTYFIDRLPPQLQGRLVHGYQGEQGFARQIPRGTDVSLYNLSYLDAAGSLFATNADVARWFQALFTSNQILNNKQFRTLVRPNAEGYAFGVNVRYSNTLQTPFYIYEGMTLGYRALYIYVPAKDLFISILANSSYDGANNHLFALANRISERYLE